MQHRHQGSTRAGVYSVYVRNILFVCNRSPSVADSGGGGGGGGGGRVPAWASLIGMSFLVVVNKQSTFIDCLFTIHCLMATSCW